MTEPGERAKMMIELAAKRSKSTMKSSMATTSHIQRKHVRTPVEGIGVVRDSHDNVQHTDFVKYMR